MTRTHLLASLIAANLSVFGHLLSAQAELNDARILHPVENIIGQDVNPESAPTAYEILNQQAVDAIMASRWSEAFKILNQAIALDPAQSEAYLNYGRAHFIRNEYPSAELALLKAQEADPSNAAAWYEYAKLMVIKNEPVLAFESANKAVVLTDSRAWKYLVLLGELSAHRGDRSGAELAFDNAIEVLKARYAGIDRAIDVEESKSEITGITHDIELVGDIGGGMTEVPVTHIETERKLAPKSWTELRARLASKIDEVEARKEEVLASMPPADLP